MTKTPTSAALRGAEELLNTLTFDCRYGTHVQGNEVTVTVTMMPEPAGGRVRGMLYCHVFGHLRPDWSAIDVLLDYGSDYLPLKFNHLGAASFECERPAGLSFQLFAMLTAEALSRPQEVLVEASQFEDGTAPPAQPVIIDKIPRDSDLAASLDFGGGNLSLCFETKANRAGQQVVFWLRTADGVVVTAGRKDLAFSPSDERWRAQWEESVAIPRETTRLALLYWVVPREDTTRP